MVANLLQIPALNKVCLIRWNPDTLYTPYKDGLTAASLGFALGFANSSNFGVVIAFASGSTDVYVRALNSGTWTSWVIK